MQNQFKPSSNPVQTQFKTSSKPVQNQFKTSSNSFTKFTNSFTVPFPAASLCYKRSFTCFFPDLSRQPDSGRSDVPLAVCPGDVYLTAFLRSPGRGAKRSSGRGQAGARLGIRNVTSGEGLNLLQFSEFLNQINSV